MNWVKVCDLNDIPTLGSRVVVSDSGRIAIFRNAEDQVFALQDCCYHKGGPLSQGIVSGTEVSCPLHNRVTKLDTGQAAPPDKGCSKRYKSKVEDGGVYLKFKEGAAVSLEALAEVV